MRSATSAIAGCRKRRVRNAGSSGGLLPPSPPAEKATACEDQARQASTDDGAGDSSGSKCYWDRWVGEPFTANCARPEQAIANTATIEVTCGVGVKKEVKRLPSGHREGEPRKIKLG